MGIEPILTESQSVVLTFTLTTPYRHPMPRINTSMLCFKQIQTHLLPEIQQSVKKYTLAELQGKSSAVDWYLENISGLQAFAQQLNLNRIHTIYCMALAPGARVHCHIDQTNTINRKWAVNIPIENTSNTRMRWFGSAKCMQIYQSDKPAYGDYPVFSEHTPSEIANLELLTPHFVRTDIPHSVWSSNKAQRMILSITSLDPVADCWPEYEPAPEFSDYYTGVGKMYNYLT